MIGGACLVDLRGLIADLYLIVGQAGLKPAPALFAAVSIFRVIAASVGCERIG